MDIFSCVDCVLLSQSRNFWDPHQDCFRQQWYFSVMTRSWASLSKYFEPLSISNRFSNRSPLLAIPCSRHISAHALGSSALFFPPLAKTLYQPVTYHSNAITLQRQTFSSFTIYSRTLCWLLTAMKCFILSKWLEDNENCAAKLENQNQIFECW